MADNEVNPEAVIRWLIRRMTVAQCAQSYIEAWKTYQDLPLNTPVSIEAMYELLIEALGSAGGVDGIVGSLQGGTYYMVTHHVDDAGVATYEAYFVDNPPEDKGGNPTGAPFGRGESRVEAITALRKIAADA